MATSPFAPSTSQPGHGSIILDLLPPSTPVLRTISYQYPLKLVAPDPLPPPTTAETTADDPSSPPPLIHTIFLLSYGGGLVAGDAIHLKVSLASRTRLILLASCNEQIRPFDGGSHLDSSTAGQCAERIQTGLGKEGMYQLLPRLHWENVLTLL